MTEDELAWPPPEAPFLDEEIALERIRALTSTARTTWLVLLGFLAFIGLTLLSVRDVDFFSVSATTQLPIVNISIPTTTFFWTAALLAAILHTYFHVFLLKLWDALAEAPPDIGVSKLGDRVFPWLVNDWALRRRADRSTTERPMDWLADSVTFLLIWLATPIVLAGFWWLSMPAHELLLTLTIAVALSASLYASLHGWRRAKARLRSTGHARWRRGRLSSRFQLPWRRTALIVAILLVVISALQNRGRSTSRLGRTESRASCLPAPTSSTPRSRSSPTTGAIRRSRGGDSMWSGAPMPGFPSMPAKRRSTLIKSWHASAGARTSRSTSRTVTAPTAFARSTRPSTDEWQIERKASYRQHSRSRPAWPRFAQCRRERRLSRRRRSSRGAAGGGEPPRGAAGGGEPQPGAAGGGGPLARRGWRGRTSQARLEGADLRAAGGGGPRRGAAGGGEPRAGAGWRGRTSAGRGWRGRTSALGAAGGGEPREARLEGADLRGARLEGANLRGAQFQSAEWAGATFAASPAHSADFTAGKNLTQTQLAQVIGDDDTVLPLDAETGEQLYVWSCWEEAPPNSRRARNAVTCGPTPTTFEPNGSAPKARRRARSARLPRRSSRWRIGQIGADPARLPGPDRSASSRSRRWRSAPGRRAVAGSSRGR